MSQTTTVAILEEAVASLSVTRESRKGGQHRTLNSVDFWLAGRCSEVYRGGKRSKVKSGREGSC